MAHSERSFIRTYNRYNILNTIRTAGMISRVKIAKVLGLNKASLTRITAELIKEGLILEKQHGDAYQVGRRPILLALNPDGVYAVGISLRMNRIQVVIINFQAEIKTTYALPLQENYYTPQELVEKIALAVEGCIERSTFSKDQISGVGVSIPGLVDSRSGIIRYLPNYGWSDINLKPMLQDKMGTNIYIDNEANNITIAEHWFGECVKSDNFIVILIENGIGAGYVLNGQLVRGNLGIAGEFGHLSINPDGPLCRCGKKGCIEAYAGVYAIMRDASRISSSEKWNVASKLDSSFQKLIEEVNRGNQGLEEVFDQAGKALGIGLSNLMALLNPEKIIITGKGVQAGKLLFDPMFASIKNGHSGRIGHYDPEILIANWTNEDFAKGAGTLVLQEIYKSPAFEN